MIETLLVILRRLCVCGIFSAVVLSIARESASAEIIRICCACIMVIAIFSPVSAQGEPAGLDFEHQDFQDQADTAVESFRQNQNDAMCREVETYAMQRTGGEITIEGIIDGNVLKITSATVCGAVKSRAEVTQILAQECGINQDCITFLEG